MHVRRITSRHRDGFTFVELCLGLVVLSLVLGAMASFTLAVANCWRYSAAAKSSTLNVSQLHARLQKWLIDSKRIGLWSSGDDSGVISGVTNVDPAGLIFWRGDANGDGQMQRKELAAIVFSGNGRTKSIDVYSTDDGDDVWSTGDLQSAAAIQNFTQDLTPSPLLRNVISARLAVTGADSSSSAPLIQWEFDLDRGDGTVASEIVAIALRGPCNP